MSWRGSDKSIMGMRAKKKNTPQNTSMNYRLRSCLIVHLFLLVCVEEQDRKGKDNMSNLKLLLTSSCLIDTVN